MANYANDKQDIVQGTLGALNDTVTLSIGNYTTAGFTLLSGTLAATILLDLSFDGGTNWVVGTLLDPSTSLISTGNVVTNPNPVIVRSIIVNSGVTHVRIRVSAYTSGTANAVITASSVAPNQLLTYGLSNTLGIVPIHTDAVGNLTPAGANLLVTGTAATGTGVTITLPAVAGQFHYITAIELTKYFTATNAASGTPLIVTTTNLPGSLAFSFNQQLGVIGVTESRFQAHTSPIKSSASNTNTTIVCPATTGIIWRATAYYYTAP